MNACFFKACEMDWIPTSLRAVWCWTMKGVCLSSLKGKSNYWQIWPCWLYWQQICKQAE